MARQIVTFDDDYDYEPRREEKSYSESTRSYDEDESDIDKALRDSMRLLKESKSRYEDEDDPFADLKDVYSEGANEIAERPSAKIKDQYEVPVPKSSDIPLDAYSKQLADLKRSFKENCELIEMIDGSKY